MKLIERTIENPEDDAIILEYHEFTQEFEDIKNYILDNGQLFPVYNKEKALIKLKIKEILYFEAVGELVFAYTGDQVYEIKKRLYQLEQSLESHKIIRASKSMLLNLRQIRSVRPAVNGRFYAKMSNGEEVLISRQYAKGVTAQVMSA